MFSIDNDELSKEMIFGPNKLWWNTYSNLLHQVRSTMNLPKHVIMKDETLREGLTVPGRKHIGVEQVVRVAKALEDAGFKELEVGYTAAVAEHREFAVAMKKSGVSIKQSAHTRTWAEDWKKEIDGVIAAGADIVNLIGFGTAETEKFVVPGIRKEEFASLVRKEVEYAKNRGAFTAFMLSTNITRPDINYHCYTAAAEAGADRIYFADGYGCSNPEAVKYFFTWLRDLVGPRPQLAIHNHNDFGLASANALAAVTAGAEVVDVSVNGLGDRAGVASTEEVVAALEILYDVRTGIKLEKLGSLSKLAEEVWGIKNSPLKGVVGENIYRHETDIHIAALLSGLWYAYNVIHPELIGSEMSLEFGQAALSKGNLSAVGVKIAMMGLKANDQQFDVILDKIRAKIKDSSRGFATEEEVATIIKSVLKS